MDGANKLIFGIIILVIIVAGAFAIFAKERNTLRTHTNIDTNMATFPEVSEDATTGQATDELLANKAIFKTNRGDIEIELYDFAPATANNFITLAQNGFYDGTRFHRVIEGFMIQGGDPLSADLSAQVRWGTGGPGYAIKDEFADGMTNVTGTIAMANSGPNSGGSQFFINVADNTGLDFDKEPLTSKHPVFGRVTAGMDVVMAISQTETEIGDRPVEEVVIQEVVIQ